MRFFDEVVFGVIGTSSLTSLGGLGSRTGEPDLLEDMDGLTEVVMEMMRGEVARNATK